MTRFVLALFGLLLFIPYLANPAPASAESRLVSARSTACTAANASMHFEWVPMPGAQSQWLDLSVTDNDFADNTYVGFGSMAGTTTSTNWANLEPGVPHFWRINTLTPAGWATSATGTFVPCGSSALALTPRIRCEADGTATVEFRWSPSAVGTSHSQWLDLSIEDNGFAPGTFVAAGPIGRAVTSYTWPGIQTGQMHVFRVNTLSEGGWRSMPKATFVACGRPTREGVDRPPAIPGAEAVGERWVLVDTERQETTAMIGGRPLYTALVTTGKEGWETPKGTFRIIYRVMNETMTSESIGAEEYYVLKDVLYTQYFTRDGHALHLNYWRSDSYFGETASSHGCVGMRLEAAEFFWRFARNGTRVTVI